MNNKDKVKAFERERINPMFFMTLGDLGGFGMSLGLDSDRAGKGNIFSINLDTFNPGLSYFQTAFRTFGIDHIKTLEAQSKSKKKIVKYFRIKIKINIDANKGVSLLKLKEKEIKRDIDINQLANFKIESYFNGTAFKNALMNYIRKKTRTSLINVKKFEFEVGYINSSLYFIYLRKNKENLMNFLKNQVLFMYSDENTYIEWTIGLNRPNIDLFELFKRRTS
ncbi:MAG: hypothetical protein EU547_02530 [Promethearchaeota archaeon]|nr:MAG: hypothetical protein EU547_02530 [Candidatus Lokiarchaeota archaeon]